jgi:arylsulfatase A-like enzyme
MGPCADNPQSEPPVRDLTALASLAMMHSPSIPLADRNMPMLMSSRTAIVEEPGSSSRDLAGDPLGLLSLLILSAWCGLVAGLLEVGATILHKRALDLNHLYKMSHHFIWLIPSITLVLFLLLGVVLSSRLWYGRRGRWLALRLLCALTLLAPIWAFFPGIYGPAGFLLALGLAARLVPAFERHASSFQRLVRVGLPVAAGFVSILAAWLWASDRIKTWREDARPLPAAGSPNVLFIVLDTVGADHLDLYGYNRPTSPTLDELASRGIRFDRAQAPSSWTLPSHATMFTGRWPHELSAGWLTPMDGTYPTLAEFVGSRGYTTAGFIANTSYCGADSGLARGFTEYQDYTFPRLTAFKATVLVDRPLEGIRAIESFLEDWLDFDGLGPAVDQLWRLFKIDRKETPEVNRAFLDWLSRRRRPERPFFAFLNFFEAHHPYQLAEKAIHRFGARPRTRMEQTLIRDWRLLIQKRPSPRQVDFARDAYDDCVADLDEELGRLIDELDRRSILERTWVIITADHGESFGEQPGVFWHGTSLYQAQVHVPLVIMPPAGGPSPRVVAQAVSLRDAAATVVDIAGLHAGSPFPGESLARFWSESSPATSTQAARSQPVLSEVVPLQSYGLDPSRWSDEPRWPLVALTDGDWAYIRHEEDGREELFELSRDAQERHDLASDPAMRPRLEQMREAASQLTAGPLTPQRFRP